MKWVKFRIGLRREAQNRGSGWERKGRSSVLARRLGLRKPEASYQIDVPDLLNKPYCSPLNVLRSLRRGNKTCAQLLTGIDNGQSGQGVLCLAYFTLKQLAGC